MRRSRRAVACLCFTTLALPAGGARAADQFHPSSTSPFLGTCGVAADGFRLPGTDGCLRINGFVAVEGGWTLASPGMALSSPAQITGPALGRENLSRSALGVGTRLSADLQLPTENGPVRVYMSLRGRNGLATDHATR